MELFGVDNQTTIEKGVWSVPVSRRRPTFRVHRANSRLPTSLRFQSTSSSSALSRPSGPTKAQVLTELEVILAQKTRAVEINPWDEQAASQVENLLQVSRSQSHRVGLLC